MQEELNVVKWLTVCTSVLLLMFAVIGLFSFKAITTSYDAEIAQLKMRCQQLEATTKAHDEIMVTYQFFNEHWNALMRGETGGIYDGN